MPPVDITPLLGPVDLIDRPIRGKAVCEQQGCFYSGDDHVANPPVAPRYENKSDRGAPSGNYAAADLDEIVSEKEGPPLVTQESEIVPEKEETPPTTQGNENTTNESACRTVLAVAPPKAIPSTDRPPRLYSSPSETSDNDLENNLRALHACIGLPRPSYSEVLRRQHLSRDLRLDPSLCNWAVFGIAPGASPGDVRPPGIAGISRRGWGNDLDD